MQRRPVPSRPRKPDVASAFAPRASADKSLIPEKTAFDIAGTPRRALI
jgi:hypothetical protein